MDVRGLFMVLLGACVPYVHSFSCTNTWSSFKGFGVNESWYTCPGDRYYMNGMARSGYPKSAGGEKLHRLESIECCHAPTMWRSTKERFVREPLKNHLSHNHSWANCPPGFFLGGFYALGGEDKYINGIEKGLCVRPAFHPDYYEECYYEDITTCFEVHNTCRCRNNYYITGIYRGHCPDLRCIDYLRCCKMATTKYELRELEPTQLQTYLMKETLPFCALLANFMGFYGTKTCKAEAVGEGYTYGKDDSTWTSGLCDDDPLLWLFGCNFEPSMCYPGEYFFKIKYEFGNLVKVNTVYESKTTSSGGANIIDYGVLYNNHSQPATKSIQRTVSSIRSVSHSTSSTDKYSHFASLLFEYKPGASGGIGGSVGYSFRYETSETTTDLTNNIQQKNFTLINTKTIGPYSASRYELRLEKHSIKQKYCATVRPHFSVEMKGIVSNTTFYRPGGQLLLITHTFGDNNIPFWDALKTQIDQNQNPWDWHNLKSYYQITGLLNFLTKRENYFFKICGTFEEITGYEFISKWSNEPLDSRK